MKIAARLAFLSLVLIILLWPGRVVIAQSESLVWTGSGPEGGDIYCLAIDPSNPNTLYAGVFGGGVFKSKDGGENWFDISFGLNSTHVSSIAIDPSNNAVIYAATRDHGIFKSTNGGTSWFPMSGGLTSSGVSTVAIAPSDPGVVYAATMNGVFQLQMKRVEITSVDFAPPKKLTISGMNLSNSPRIIINDVERTDFITDASDSSIQIKGKAKKLKLKPGDNRIMVITSTGTATNVFILRI